LHCILFYLLKQQTQFTALDTGQLGELAPETFTMQTHLLSPH